MKTKSTDYTMINIVIGGIGLILIVLFARFCQPVPTPGNHINYNVQSK